MRVGSQACFCFPKMRVCFCVAFHVFCYFAVGDQEGSVEVPRSSPFGGRQRNHGHDRRQPHVSLVCLVFCFLFFCFAPSNLNVNLNVGCSRDCGVVLSPTNERAPTSTRNLSCVFWLVVRRVAVKRITIG